jgi:hypothetical protein
MITNHESFKRRTYGDSLNIFKYVLILDLSGNPYKQGYLMAKLWQKRMVMAREIELVLVEKPTLASGTLVSTNGNGSDIIACFGDILVLTCINTPVMLGYRDVRKWGYVNITYHYDILQQ